MTDPAVDGYKPKAVKQLHIGDFGKDLDDEVATLMSAALIRSGQIELLGTIANLDPPASRARLAKGTYKSLGLDIPVAMGTTCSWSEGKSLAYQFELPYMSSASELVPSGAELFRRVTEQVEDGELNLVLMSGFTDANELLEHDPQLFQRKVGSVTLMSGIETDGGEVRFDARSFMTPNRTDNNNFDFESSQRLYASLQRLEIPMTIVTRDAAFAGGVPRSFYDTLAESGHPIGRRLQKAQSLSIQHLWEQANLPKDHPDRELPWGPPDNPRTAQWFRNAFCGGGGEGLTGTDSIWPHVQRFAQYDGLTVVASHPDLRREYFSASEVTVGSTTHEVIGISSERNGVKDPVELTSFFTDAARTSLDLSLSAARRVERESLRIAPTSMQMGL